MVTNLVDLKNSGELVREGLIRLGATKGYFCPNIGFVNNFLSEVPSFNTGKKNFIFKNIDITHKKLKNDDGDWLSIPEEFFKEL